MALTFSPTADTSKVAIGSGEFIVTLKEIEQEQITEEQKAELAARGIKRDKPRLKFVFGIDEVLELTDFPDDVDEEDEAAVNAYADGLLGDDIYEWCNFTMGPNSTLRFILDGMNGKPLDKAVNEEDFLNKKYKMTRGWKTFNIDGRAISKLTITAIRPHKQGGFRKPKTEDTSEDAPLF